MTETTSDISVTGGASATVTPAVRAVDPTDTPISLWPEGVIAALAGVALLAIGLKHRTWLQRKATDAQRAVEEFQRHGGLDELTQVARQAQDFLKGASGK